MIVRKHSILVGAILSAAVVATISPVGSAPTALSTGSSTHARWCFHVLPVPARFDSATASDVSNRGLVVGTAYGRETGAQAVVWRHGRLLALRDRGTDSSATAINDHHMIIGSSDGRPAVWRKGRMHILPGDGVARDLNDHGVIVGNSGEFWRPTIWRRGHVRVLPGDYQEVLGVDDSGMMVGHDGVWPLVWRHGVASFLSFPEDFEFGQASAANGGVIVGEGDDGGTWAAPVVWHNLKPRELPWQQDLDDAGYARDVNERGVIVGGKSPARGANLAVVWVNDRYHVLPSPPNESGAYADAVSDTGLIIGGWNSKPVLWTPAGESGC